MNLKPPYSQSATPLEVFTHHLLRWLSRFLLVIPGLMVLLSFFVSVFKQSNIGDLTSTLLAAIGVLGLLSGVCMAYAPVIEGLDRAVAVRIGENFLLACVLFFNALIIRYCLTRLVAKAFIIARPWLLKECQLYGLLSEKFFACSAIAFSIGGVANLSDLLLIRLTPALKPKLEEKIEPEPDSP